MYIRQKLESAAKPDRKRQIVKLITFPVNIVEKSPKNPDKFDKISAGKRPILSESKPQSKVPTTDPIKKNDCPTRAL